MVDNSITSAAAMRDSHEHEPDAATKELFAKWWDAYEEKREAFLNKLGNPCLLCDKDAASKVKTFEKKHKPFT